MKPEKTSVEEMIVLERWRLESGLVSQDLQNNLFMYGSIIHRDVIALEMDIIIEKKEIKYKVYCPKKVLKKVDTFNKLRGTTSLFGLWRLRRLLKKEGNLDLPKILNNFVKDLCGPKWSASLTLLPDTDYKDVLANEVVQSKDDQVKVG